MIQKLCRFLSLSPRELLVLVLVFAATLPAVTPRIYSSDEVQYYSYLRSLWFDHDVSFENEYGYFYDQQIAQTPDFHETFLERRTPAGRRINFATIGSAILWSPFYAMADAWTRVTGRALADGFSKPYIAAVAYGSAVYAFAAVLLGIRAARQIVGGGGLFAGLAVWFGTPLFFYMYVAPPFSHACSAFAVALFITVWLHVRRTWSPGGAIALGLSGALMTMVREQDVFFLFGPAVDFMAGSWVAVRTGQGVRRMMTAAVAGCAAFGAGMLPQLLAYRALNGHPGPSDLVTRKMLWHSPHALEVVLSPAHGFLIWTPLAALAIAGLVVLALRDRHPDVDGTASDPGSVAHDGRRVAWCLLLMVVLQVYVSGAVDSWSVAGAFGHRRFVAVSSILIIGLAALWHWTAGARTPAAPARARWALIVVVALCVYWNLALIALFGTRMMDRQRVEIGRNAYDAFITLPRMAPDLLWRYIARRDSFYKPRASGGGGQ